MSSYKTSADVLAKVRQVVAEQFCLEEEEFSNDSHFMTDLGADSLDIVELVMTLEEVFEMEVSDEYTTKIQTVQEAVDVISIIIGVK
jgi:acyl carrier protein